VGEEKEEKKHNQLVPSPLPLFYRLSLLSSSASKSSSRPATCFWKSFRTTGLTGKGGGTAGVTPRECLTIVQVRFFFFKLDDVDDGDDGGDDDDDDDAS